MIVTYRQGDLYSAAIAGGGVVVYQMPKSVAASAICNALGVTLSEANAMLDKPASPAEWRSTWASAVSAGLDELSSEVAEIKDRERADNLAGKIQAARAMLAEVLTEQLKANAIGDERNRLDAQRLAAHEREVKQREDAATEQARLVAERQRHAAEEERKRRDLRAVRNSDGTVDVTEAHETKTGNQTMKVRRLVARYKVGEVPPEVAALLK